MKAIIILVLIAVSQMTPITQEYLDTLRQKSSFEVYKTTEEHPFKDFDDINDALGLDTTYLKDTSSFPLGLDMGLPESFDSRVGWPDCIHPIRNQLKCGSCWAFGASEVLSDRFCISSKGAINVILSPQDLVSCDFFDHGCNGGNLLLSWLYLRIYGITTDLCKPYTAGDGHVDKCEKKCSVPDQQYKKYKADSFFMPTTIAQMKEDIMNNGPIETGFLVYDDFLNYKSGIYQKTAGSVLKGGHAVKIIGWGVENGINYWICANSWGPTWGEEGFFRIGMGECGIENCISGSAKVN